MKKNTSNIKVSGTTAKLLDILKAKNGRNGPTKGPKSNFKPQQSPKSFIRRSGPRGG